MASRPTATWKQESNNGDADDDGMIPIDKDPIDEFPEVATIAGQILGIRVSKG